MDKFRSLLGKVGWEHTRRTQEDTQYVYSIIILSNIKKSELFGKLMDLYELSTPMLKIRHIMEHNGVKIDESDYKIEYQTTIDTGYPTEDDLTISRLVRNALERKC